MKQQDEHNKLPKLEETTFYRTCVLQSYQNDNQIKLLEEFIQFDPTIIDVLDDGQMCDQVLETCCIIPSSRVLSPEKYLKKEEFEDCLRGVLESMQANTGIFQFFYEFKDREATDGIQKMILFDTYEIFSSSEGGKQSKAAQKQQNIEETVVQLSSIEIIGGTHIKGILKTDEHIYVYIYNNEGMSARIEKFDYRERGHKHNKYQFKFDSINKCLTQYRMMQLQFQQLKHHLKNRIHGQLVFMENEKGGKHRLLDFYGKEQFIYQYSFIFQQNEQQQSEQHGKGKIWSILNLFKTLRYFHQQIGVSLGDTRHVNVTKTCLIFTNLSNPVRATPQQCAFDIVSLLETVQDSHSWVCLSQKIKQILGLGECCEILQRFEKLVSQIQVDIDE